MNADVNPSGESAPADDAASALPSKKTTRTKKAAELAEAQTPVEPDPARDEADRIEPVPTGPIVLQNGMEIEVVPLRLRETMKLLKIVTRGAGPVLEQLMGDMDLNDPAAFAQTLGALIIMSIPEAENEAVEFIQSMVRPANFDELPQPEKISQINALMLDLNNPDLEDVVTVVETVVRRESEDIRNLGKRIGTAFKMSRKVGLIK